MLVNDPRRPGRPGPRCSGFVDDAPEGGREAVGVVARLAPHGDVLDHQSRTPLRRRLLECLALPRQRPGVDQHGVHVEVGGVLEERREDAERLLNDLAAEVNEWAGVMPSLTVRDGHIGEEILAAVAEDPTINFLVVGAAPPPHKHGKLISWLAGHTAESLNIPLVIVPGNLTDEQLINIT